MSEQEEFRALRGTEQIDVVTGEAVLLDIPAATLPQRMASGLIDVIVTYLGFFATLWLLASSLTSISDINIQTLLLVNMILWFVVLPVTIETVTRGRTLGKWVLRLRTVRDDGGPIVFRHALVRGLVGAIEKFSFSGIVAVFAAMSTERCRRLGDMAAGTYVVREATHIKLQSPTEMPHGLATWARSADMAPLPDGVALAIRQLLEREATLTPQARYALTQELLGRVLPLVAPQPPSAPGNLVLAAILAERRRRDEERLRTEADVRRRLLPADQL